MRTSMAIPAGRGGRRAAATFALLLLLSGCAAEAGSAPQPVEGLLVLVRGDTTSLDVLAAKSDADETVAIGLPLPAQQMTWISAGDGGVLLGTTAKGDLLLSDPVDPRGSAADLAGLEWKPVKAKDEAGAALEAPARYGSWDPSGKRFAALGGDLPGGADITLYLVEPGAGKVTTIALKRPLLPAPPVWLGADRLTLLTGSSSAPAAIVVDTANGKISDGPAGDRRLATSGDGRVIATSAGAGASVVIRSSKGWASDDGTSIGSVEIPAGFSEAISLALDAAGDRLAIVWLGADGTPRYDIHDGTDGWRRVASEPLSGAAAAAVAWLR